MERLTNRDLRALLEFLRQTYVILDFNSFVAHILKTLPSLVPSEVTSYNEMDVTNSVSEDWVEPAEVGAPAQLEAWERVMHEDPIVLHYVRTRNGRAVKNSDFLTQSQFHRMALYNEHYRRMRIEDAMGFLFPASPTLVGAVGLHRHRVNFTERDRLILDLLRPHFVQARANAKAVTELNQKLAALSQTLETVAHGVIVLSPDGRATLVTAHARQCLAAYFSPSRRPDSVPEALLQWVKQQLAFLAHPSDAPPPRTPLVIERSGKRLVVRLISDSSQRLLLFEERRTTLEVESLEALGLTRRETEVLVWVAQGKTNGEIGTILGSSARTVEKHLERLFRKLGVETRTAAAAVAFEATGLTPGGDR